MEPRPELIDGLDAAESATRPAAGSSPLLSLPPGWGIAVTLASCAPAITFTIERPRPILAYFGALSSKAASRWRAR